MGQKKVYLVHNYEDGAPPRAVFDSKEEYIDLALKNGYDFNRSELYCYALAKDEGEALMAALKTRDKLIAKGEWAYYDEKPTFE
ncbi:hypothetical protein [Parapedobacter sp. DT-150]|uniref:hypothetical protein n=1 Tax=Parapedobacter sp. DT-150 TaxID=3396162 RepID=UPI003F1A1F0E